MIFDTASRCILRPHFGAIFRLAWDLSGSKMVPGRQECPSGLRTDPVERCLSQMVTALDHFQRIFPSDLGCFMAPHKLLSGIQSFQMVSALHSFAMPSATILCMPVLDYFLPRSVTFCTCEVLAMQSQTALTLSRPPRGRGPRTAGLCCTSGPNC